MVAGLPALAVAGQERGHRRPVVLDLDHAAVELDGPSLGADPVASHFPHLARARAADTGTHRSRS